MPATQRLREVAKTKFEEAGGTGWDDWANDTLPSGAHTKTIFKRVLALFEADGLDATAFKRAALTEFPNLTLPNEGAAAVASFDAGASMRTSEEKLRALRGERSEVIVGRPGRGHHQPPLPIWSPEDERASMMADIKKEKLEEEGAKAKPDAIEADEDEWEYEDAPREPIYGAVDQMLKDMASKRRSEAGKRGKVDKAAYLWKKRTQDQETAERLTRIATQLESSITAAKESESSFDDLMILFARMSDIYKNEANNAGSIAEAELFMRYHDRVEQELANLASQASGGNDTTEAPPDAAPAPPAQEVADQIPAEPVYQAPLSEDLDDDMSASSAEVDPRPSLGPVMSEGLDDDMSVTSVEVDPRPSLGADGQQRRESSSDIPADDPATKAQTREEGAYQSISRSATDSAPSESSEGVSERKDPVNDDVGSLRVPSDGTTVDTFRTPLGSDPPFTSAGSVIDPSEVSDDPMPDAAGSVASGGADGGSIADAVAGVGRPYPSQSDQQRGDPQAGPTQGMAGAQPPQRKARVAWPALYSSECRFLFGASDYQQLERLLVMGQGGMPRIKPAVIGGRSAANMFQISSALIGVYGRALQIPRPLISPEAGPEPNFAQMMELRQLVVAYNRYTGQCQPQYTEKSQSIRQMINDAAKKAAQQLSSPASGPSDDAQRFGPQGDPQNQAAAAVAAPGQAAGALGSRGATRPQNADPSTALDPSAIDPVKGMRKGKSGNFMFAPEDTNKAGAYGVPRSVFDINLNVKKRDRERDDMRKPKLKLHRLSI